ncbi:MAG: DUF3822 family protein [Jejuia sp.]
MAQKRNKNSEIKTYKKLSIQISLSGLSFCILNTITSKVEAFEQIEFDKKLNPFEALERLIHFFDTREYLQIQFDDILVIHENDLSTLVPKALFNEDYLADYLKFNSKILKSDFISYDTIHRNESVNVYVPYVNVNNYIYETFGAFTFKHFSTILIDEILKNEVNILSPRLYIHISKEHFEIIITEKGNLLLYNTFEYNNDEDFIYYVLFTMEQLKLDVETTKVVLLGNISKDSSLYKIAFKYIRHISISEYNDRYGFMINGETDQSSFIITHSF